MVRALQGFKGLTFNSGEQGTASASSYGKPIEVKLLHEQVEPHPFTRAEEPFPDLEFASGREDRTTSREDRTSSREDRISVRGRFEHVTETFKGASFGLFGN